MIDFKTDGLDYIKIVFFHKVVDLVDRTRRAVFYGQNAVFTEEVVNMPADMGAFLSSRSSLGRAGLLVTFSTWINPGYSGRISVELYNASSVPLRIRSGIRVLQGIFVPLSSQAEYGYAGKYQNSIEPTGSRLHEEFVPQKGAGNE